MLDPHALVTGEDDLRERLVPVLLGGDILTYSCVRGFYEAYGVHSLVMTGFDPKIISTSRFATLRIVPDVDQEAVCVEALRSVGAELIAQGKVPLVLGTGDWYARILSQHKEELSEWFVVPYVDFPLLDEITQKERFYEICEELGIPYPKTWTYDCADPGVTIPADEFSYPVIAKPSNSARYHYADIPGKKKVYTIETPGELSKLFSDLQASSYDRELIVQDCIPGADDCLHYIMTFSDAAGDVRIWSTGRVLLEDHMPTAVGNPVCVYLERNDEIAAQAARFVKRVGYHGFANFDVKRDPRDGSYRFFEINTRPGRSTYCMTIGGVNFVKPLVEEFVLGVPVEERVACDEGLFTVVPRQVVSRTVEDPVMRRKALALYDAGRAVNPLFFKEDSVAHLFWARLAFFNQVRKFKRYVWDVKRG